MFLTLAIGNVLFLPKEKTQSLSEMVLMVIRRSVAFAFLLTMMGLSCGNSLVGTISTVPVLISGSISMLHVHSANTTF